MPCPGYGSSIFNRIRLEAGLKALKLARSMEKTTYKLEAHHRHLHFTHKALEQGWYPKSLRFRPPGNQLIFKRIMEQVSRHCMKARISICHNQIKGERRTLRETSKELTPLISDNTSTMFQNFLKKRAEAVRSSIQSRHDKKLVNLRNEDNSTTHSIAKKNWVVNLSKNRFLPLNVFFWKRAQNLPQPRTKSRTRILSLK